MKAVAVLIITLFITLISILGCLSLRGALGQESILTTDTRIPQASARLILRSGQTQFTLGQSATANLIIDTAGARIDEADLALSFSPAAIRIDKVVAAESTCSGPLSQAIDTIEGTIHLHCSLARSSQLPQLATLATVSFTPLSAESSLIKSTSESHLIGNQHEVLRTPALLTVSAQ